MSVARRRFRAQVVCYAVMSHVGGPSANPKRFANLMQRQLNGWSSDTAANLYLRPIGLDRRGWRQRAQAPRRFLLRRYQQVGVNLSVYRDPANGIAWVEDHDTGLQYGAHPFIEMPHDDQSFHERIFSKRQVEKAWNKHYVIGYVRTDDALATIARLYCRCKGNHDVDPRAAAA